MNGEILQTHLSGSFDELSDQQSSQAIVPMFGHDIHALDVARQPRPLFGPRDPFDDDEPRHARGSTVQLDHERQMCPAMFGHPGSEVASKPAQVSLFVPFHRPPGPSQPRQLLNIGEIGSASRSGSFGAGTHNHKVAPIADSLATPLFNIERGRSSPTLGLRWPWDEGGGRALQQPR
jgi:hypothetical protein